MSRCLVLDHAESFWSSCYTIVNAASFYEVAPAYVNSIFLFSFSYNGSRNLGFMCDFLKGWMIIERLCLDYGCQEIMVTEVSPEYLYTIECPTLETFLVQRSYSLWHRFYERFLKLIPRHRQEVNTIWWILPQIFLDLHSCLHAYLGRWSSSNVEGLSDQTL